jgi:hypothetical protein
MSERDVLRALEAVTVGDPARLELQHFDGDDFRSVKRD